VKGSSSRGAAGKRPVVLVFGESEHDRRAIVRLVGAMRPDLKRAVEARRQPLVLIKGALPPRAKANAEEIARKVAEENGARTVLAVLAHQDCDRVEPAHEEVGARIESELRLCGCHVVAVAPAWEIEAWWMIFPEAVGKVVQGWRDPTDWLGRDVGQVENAKEALAVAVQPRPKRRKPPRPYEEHDSIAIAENIAAGDLLRTFDRGYRVTAGRVRTRSASFERFRRGVVAIPST
jgi:hypothetical protein